MINRRSWMQLGSGAMLAALASRSSAAEGRGKWSDESIANQTTKLMEWLKANFALRASTLASATGADFPLEYDYLKDGADKSRQRLFQKYAEGRLSGKSGENHVQTCLTEFERIRVSLAAAEKLAFNAWEMAADSAEVKEGRIYDSTVQSGQLTVVLDNSHSMSPFLDAVRAEISRDFASAYFVEVNGCEMTRPPSCPWFFSAPSLRANPFAPDRHIPKVPTVEDRPFATFIGWTRDAPSALTCMVDLMKTDAIYWFCDFDDPTEDSYIRDFARKVMAQKVKLYIHTLGKRPPTLLATLAETSGGQVIRKKI